MTISNAITATVQSHVYQLQCIDCSRLRGPGLSSVLQHTRAAGAGVGGVGVGRVVIALPSLLGPAVAAQLKVDSHLSGRPGPYGHSGPDTGQLAGTAKVEHPGPPGDFPAHSACGHCR